MVYCIARGLLLFCFTVSLAVLSGKLDAADIEITGISDKRVLHNVRAHVESIARPTLSYQFDQYQLQLVQQSQNALEVFGYYHAQITSSAATKTGDTQDWLVAVMLGQVTRIRQLSVQIEGEGKAQPEIQGLLDSLPIKTGQPIEHGAYESTKKQLHSLALSLGYFDFEFIENRIQVIGSLKVADITLTINSGPRYRFGDLKFDKDTKARSLVTQLLPFKVGDFYQASVVTLFSQQLKQTPYFSHVLVRPLFAQSANNAVPIGLVLTHKPTDNFDIGAGLSSDEGPRFTGKWERPWVNTKGHALGAEVFLSAPEQYASLDYRIPLEDALKNYLGLQLGAQYQDNNDTVSDKVSISATRHWTSHRSDWQRSAFVRLEQETFTQGLQAQQTTLLLTPGASISRLRSKGGLDVYWGDRQTISAEFARETLFSDIDYVRLTVQSKWLRSFDKHRFLWRLELGGIDSSDFTQVPASLRYFTGGDQSIRGFSYESISPFELDANGDRELTGGRYLAVASMEYSYPVANKWRAAVFLDAGNAADKLSDEISVGTGLGANWLSPIGPVRFYLARGHNQFESAWRIHFSLGPGL